MTDISFSDKLVADENWLIMDKPDARPVPDTELER